MARFDSFKALHQSIAAGREAQETGILRFAAEIAADDDRIAAHTCRTTIHDWIESRVPGALPAEAADHGTFSFRQGGSHCEAVRVLREGHDLWAVRLRSPDPAAPAEAWVTEAGVGWMPGSAPVFHLRLLRSSSGVDARYLEPKVPELAARLASVLELRQFGEPVTGEPWLVTSTPDAERFCARLIDPRRRLPILALSVPDDAEDPHKPLLDSERLARSCLGLALVAVVPAEFAWELTDRFGRRLSVYQGAARIYLPGFTAQANERDHRLILGLSLSDPDAIERTTHSILRTVAAMSLESQPELPFEEVRRMAKAEFPAGAAPGGTAAAARPAAAGPQPPATPPIRVPAAPAPAAAAEPRPAAPPPRIVPAREAAAARLGPLPGPTRIPTSTPPPAAAPSVPTEPAPSPPEPETPAQPFWARSVRNAPRPAARPPAAPTRPSYSPGAAATDRASSFPSRVSPPRFPPATPPTRLPPAEPTSARRPDPAPHPDPGASAEAPSPTPAPAETAPPAVPPAETPAPSAPPAAEPASPPAPEPEPSPPSAAAPTPASAEESPPESSAPTDSAEPAPPGFFARLGAALRFLFGPKRAPLPALPASTGPEPEPEPEPAAPEEPSPPEPTPAEAEERARLEKEVRTLTLDLDSVRRLLTRTEQEKAKSVDELAEAQERADEAERRFDLAISQQQALADRLIELGEDPEPTAPLPTEWSRFNDWCENQLAGKVLLTPRAQREVKRAQFADVPLAARCLLWLANDFRDGRLGRKPADRRPFVEDGVHNARCGGDAFAVKWRGKSRRVDWHIKSGGSTHDPRRCLRIYYFWDSARNQAVVASMPAHIRTAAT